MAFLTHGINGGLLINHFAMSNEPLDHGEENVPYLVKYLMLGVH